jgi:hypothetical protein
MTRDLTYTVPLSPVTDTHAPKGFSMAGKIRTREVCPTCGQNFHAIEETGILCQECNTKPATYYIYLYHRDPIRGRDHKISRDINGDILDSYRRAHRLLERIRSEIDQGIFTLSNYLQKETHQFRGATEEQIEQLAGHSTRGMSKRYVKRSVEMVRHLVDCGRIREVPKQREGDSK